MNNELACGQEMVDKRRWLEEKCSKWSKTWSRADFATLRRGHRTADDWIVRWCSSMIALSTAAVRRNIIGNVRGKEPELSGTFWLENVVPDLHL